MTCAGSGSSATAATGRSARYEYYTCFSRQRYGASTCRADRLPADELDEAIIEALDSTFARSDVIEEAVHEAARRIESGQGSIETRSAPLRRRSARRSRHSIAISPPLKPAICPSGNAVSALAHCPTSSASSRPVARNWSLKPKTGWRQPAWIPRRSQPLASASLPRCGPAATRSKGPLARTRTRDPCQRGTRLPDLQGPRGCGS